MTLSTSGGRSFATSRLGAPEDEGPHAGAHVFQGFGVAILIELDNAALKGVLRTEKTGHEEFEQAPELGKRLFSDGRARKAKAHAGIDRRTARAVMYWDLDVLGLIESLC